MGEIADELVDSMYDYVDDDGWSSEEEGCILSQPTITCKFCKEKNLHWVKEESGKFKLYNKKNKLHVCKHYSEKVQEGLKY